MSAVLINATVPDGQHAPFATVSKNDHGAWIIVTTAMGLAFSMLALGARALIRQHINKGWKLDDTILTIASVGRIYCFCWVVANGAKVLSWVQSSLILGACASGLGKSVTILSASQLAHIQRVCLQFMPYEVCSVNTWTAVLRQ